MTSFSQRLADLQAQSAITDRLAAETAAEARQACAEAVAAADRMIEAIANAPVPHIID